MTGKQWERPKFHVTRKLPFIPLERESDDLTAGCGKKTATFLQLPKETGMRTSEGLRLKWTDINTQRNLITLTESDAFTIKVARTKEEITVHLELGFEWVGKKDELVYLRKRK